MAEVVFSGDIGAFTSPAHSPVQDAFQAGMFAGVDPDETGVPAAQGAMGVINTDITGTDAGDIGAPGPTPAR